MEIKSIILFVVIIFAAAFVGSMIFSHDNMQNTQITILNKGDIGENGTVYAKVVADKNGSLSDKELKVQLTDKNGKVVYTKTVKTHATGVAIIKLENMSGGQYTINITFDGDKNYSASSISQKITVSGDVTEETVENSTLIEETLAQDSASSTSQSSSYTPQSTSSRSSSSSSSSGSSSDYYEGYYDANGGRILKEYDVNGKVVDPDTL